MTTNKTLSLCRMAAPISTAQTPVIAESVAEGDEEGPRVLRGTLFSSKALWGRKSLGTVQTRDWSFYTITSNHRTTA